MDQKRNTTNLIKDIVFYYIKFYYDKELKNKKKHIMEECEIETFVNDMYTDNTDKIKTYIRNSLKKNQKENYNKFIVENILVEMFNDIEYAKNRVIIEIKTYQNNKKEDEDK